MERSGELRGPFDGPADILSQAFKEGGNVALGYLGIDVLHELFVLGCTHDTSL